MNQISVVKEQPALGAPLPWGLLDAEGSEPAPPGGIVAAVAPADKPLREAADNDYAFQDMRLRVGDRIQLQPPAAVAQDRYVVKLIGYVDNVGLLVSAPFENGLRVPLREKDKVVARIFAGEKVFGFCSKVERVCKIPYEYLHLSFPERIQGSVVRKAPRVRTNIIAVIEEVDAAAEAARQSALIVNLSADGALLKVSQPLVKIGQTIRLSFRVILHGVGAFLAVEAVVRSTLANEDKSDGKAGAWSHGIQFQRLAPNDNVILQSLIYQQMIEQPQSVT